MGGCSISPSGRHDEAWGEEADFVQELQGAAAMLVAVNQDALPPYGTATRDSDLHIHPYTFNSTLDVVTSQSMRNSM